MSVVYRVYHKALRLFTCTLQGTLTSSVACSPSRCRFRIVVDVDRAQPGKSCFWYPEKGKNSQATPN
ncbi:hypothetical protein FKM82_020451 [Ascaphus truei]